VIPTIETERLLLRPFTIDDSGEVARMAGEWIMAETSNLPHPYTTEDAQDWISTHERFFDRHEAVQLAVTRKIDGVLVGSVSLESLFENHQAELGYWIGREHWNNGYATESSLAIMNYGFKTFNLIRIHACHLTRNGGSARVLEKIGMKLEGVSPKHILKWGTPEDLSFWGIVQG